MGQGWERAPYLRRGTGNSRGARAGPASPGPEGSRPLPSSLQPCAQLGARQAVSVGNRRNEVPAPGRDPVLLDTLGSPRLTHLVPSPRSPRSPPRTSPPHTPPPSHRNVHWQLSRLQRCIIERRAEVALVSHPSVAALLVTELGRTPLQPPSLGGAEATSGPASLALLAPGSGFATSPGIPDPGDSMGSAFCSLSCPPPCFFVES